MHRREVLHEGIPRPSTPSYGGWIWSVVVDGDLYVRAYKGQRSRWYRSAIEQGAGSPYLPPMLQDGPTSATVRISPRA